MKSKLKKRIFGVLMVFVTIISTFFNVSTTVQASDLLLNEVTGYSYTGVSPFLGYAITHDPLYIMKVDGKVVFCIESGIFTESGGGYIAESYIDSKRDLLSKIAYYGYTSTSKSNYDYAVTQVLIWEQIGDQYISSTIPNYQQRKAEIMAMVSKHDTLPSWANQTYQVQVGDSLTLTDTNIVFSEMQLQSNATGASLSKNGNTLTITPSPTSNSGAISYRKVDTSYVGTSIVYRKPNKQSLVEFKLDSIKEAKVDVQVIKLGNVRVQKIDEETGNPLPNATIRFEYGLVTWDILTDENGIAEIKDIPQGTEITIREVMAPDGFVNKGEVKTITIEPNTTIDVGFDNKAQRGVLHLIKTGKKATSLETQETEYGILYDIVFEDQPLAGVTYHIEAVEDIVVGGSIKAIAGDVVATVTTNEHGELINPPELYLGSYQAVEVSAPNGYLMDPTPIPFMFTYAGQEIELVNESVNASNDFQRLKISLFKHEEVITSWKGNLPVIEEIPANDKVFGLFTGEEQMLSDGTILPADSLLHIATIQDGECILEEVQYPEGIYYFKELDAGDKHDALDLHYPFTFYPEDNQEVKEIIVFESDEVPLLNKLHFNTFSLKKLNEKATLEEKKGYTFSYEESKGAIFTLENEEETIIQTVSVDNDSLAIFQYVPVGTFYLKEKKSSSDNYVVSNEVYRIESTKEGIQVYDKNDTLLGEQTIEDTTVLPILFEVRNDLVKGTAKLEKTDVISGVALPNTGVRILDEDHHVIVEGKTDEKGTFVFRQLPKGMYYFQEFEAPEGYQLDETPIKFEIKEDGEIVKVTMTNRKIMRVVSLPKTGDATKPLFYIGIVGICASVIIGLVVNRKRNNKDRYKK